MKKKYILSYLILTVFLLSIMGIYYNDSDIYLIVNSSRYYTIFYVPLYLYLVSRVLDDYFRTVLLLRVGSKTKNAFIYMKRILFHTVLFSVCFVICFILMESMKKGVPKEADIKFYFMILFIQIFGWNVIGMFQYMIYIIMKDRNFSVAITWISCGIMAFSGSVLFRLGNYMYNIFETMTLSKTDGVSEIVSKFGINILIAISLIVVAILCQKNMDVIEKRR